jgi:MFS family permease
MWRPSLVTAAAALFLLNGLGYASLASRLPELQAEFNLSEPQLGFARSGFVIGITVAMLVAPQIVRRWRAHRVAPVAAGLYLAAVCLAGAGFGTVSFMGWLLAAGVLNALIDIGQNVIAVRLEKMRMADVPDARPNSLLSPMEGLQAVGVAAGSGFGLLTAGRLPLLPSFALLGAVGAVAALVVFVLLRGLDTTAGARPARAVDPAAHPGLSRRRRLRAAYPPRLRWLTAMSFSALLLEGAVVNWLAVLVAGSGAPLFVSGLGLTVFATTLCLGRLSYGAIAGRVDQVMFVRTMGLLVLVGIAGVALWTDEAAIVLASAAALGFGLANLHPFCTGAVGHGSEPEAEELHLGRMNRVAYTGIAFEGVLVAGLTALFGLAAALAAVGLTAAVFVAKAHLFRTERARELQAA